MRLEWIDICKAIAIFAMVFCHVGLELPSQNAGFVDWIHLWHMPIFFILSGMVLNPSKYMGWSNFSVFISNRFKTLIVPYFIFGTFCTTFGYMVSKISGFGGNFTVNEILTAFIINNECIPYGGIQWFLTALFLGEVIFVITANVIGTKRKTIILYMLFWIVGFLFIDFVDVSLPFSLLPAIFAVPFLAMGFLFKEEIKECTFSKMWLLLSVIILVSLFFVDGLHVNMRTSAYVPMYSVVIGGVTSLLIIFIVKNYESAFIKLRVYPYIKETGRNTLIILLLNSAIRKILLAAVHLQNPYLLFFAQLIATFIVIGIILALSRIVNKYCPQILGKF